MKNYFLAFLLLAFPVVCLAADPNIQAAVHKAEPTKDNILNIAIEKAKSLGYKVEEMEILYDEDNAHLKEFTKRAGVSVYNRKTGKWDKEQPSTPEKDFPALQGRDYQAVYMGPKAAQMGGDIWVFVDRNTGEVIQCVRGK